jgi:hypothetical protein
MPAGQLVPLTDFNKRPEVQKSGRPEVRVVLWSFCLSDFRTWIVYINSLTFAPEIAVKKGTKPFPSSFLYHGRGITNTDPAT